MTTITNYLSSAQIKIFDPIPSDVQGKIVSLCDVDTLVRLSGVNTQAFKLLTNEIFKKLFEDQHNHGVSYDRTPYYRSFSGLRSVHPSNCWKVICQVMDPSWKGHQLGGSITIAKRLNCSFLQEAISNVVALRSQRENNAKHLKEICGSDQALPSSKEDPNSQIGQAWEESKTHTQVLNSLQQEMEKITLQIGSLLASNPHLQFSQVEMQLINDAVKKELDEEGELNELDNTTLKCTLLQRLLSKPYEEFVKQTELGGKGMSKEHIVLFQDVAKLDLQLALLKQEFALKIQNEREFFNKYSQLAETRNKLIEEMIIADSFIKWFDLYDPAQAHISALTAEWNSASLLKEDLKNKSHLEKCAELVENLLCDHLLQTDDAFGEIRNLINECADHNRIYIWRELYFRCANGIQEDSWSEKHFQNYLPTLLSLLRTCSTAVR